MQHPSTAQSTICLEAVSRFLAEVGDGECSAARAATSFATSLASLSTAAMPAAVQDIWRKIALMLRSAPERPIPEAAVLQMRAWPSARTSTLISLVRELNARLEAIENDRLEDQIRDDIRRHYL